MKKKLVINVVATFFFAFLLFPVYAQNSPSIEKLNTYNSIKYQNIKNILLNGTPQELKGLLDSKIDVNRDYDCSTLLNMAIRSLVVNQNPSATPEETLEKVKILVDAGADVNLETCGLTPLATLTGLHDMAKGMEQTYLKTIDANIASSTDTCHVNGEAKKCKETTPHERQLMKAEISQIFQEERQKIEPYYIQIADILLEHGADINKKSKGVAPLHFAAKISKNEKPILLKYLLEKGADPNIRDFQGSTPLFVANFAGNKDVIDVLIKFGADPNIRNNKGILYKDFKTGELNRFNYQ